MKNRERFVSVPAARSYIEANVGDPILKACMNNVLDGLPAADAVGVVRCKDCEYVDFLGYSEGLLYCMKHSCYMDEDDFCSDGERRN